MYWEKKERQECPVKCTSWYWVTSQSSQHHGRTPEKEIEVCSQINKSYFGKAQFRPWCIFSKLTDVFDKFVTQKDSLCSLCLISTKLSKLNQSWEEKKCLCRQFIKWPQASIFSSGADDLYYLDIHLLRKGFNWKNQKLWQ